MLANTTVFDKLCEDDPIEEEREEEEREEEEDDRETVARALLAAAVVAASSMSSMDGPMQMTTAQGTPPGNPTPGTIGGGGILFTVPKGSSINHVVMEEGGDRGSQISQKN